MKLSTAKQLLLSASLLGLMSCGNVITQDIRTSEIMHDADVLSKSKNIESEFKKISSSENKGCSEKDADNWILHDIAGGQFKACSLLSESSASLALLFPMSDNCPECSQTYEQISQALQGTPHVIIAKILQPGDNAALHLTTEGKSDDLVFFDQSGQLKQRLNEQNISWGEPVAFAFTFSQGHYVRYDDFERFMDVIHDHLEKHTPPQTNPFVWDGLANLGHGLWKIKD